jgi:hypothetical protein
MDLINRVRALPEDALHVERLPNGHAGGLVWRDIVGRGYLHPLTHIAQLCMRRGLPDRAVQLQETVLQSLAPLDESPEWQGLLIYDLACTCALAAHLDRARQGLAEALRLRPDLIEWSRQDPDIASISGELALLDENARLSRGEVYD